MYTLDGKTSNEGLLCWVIIPGIVLIASFLVAEFLTSFVITPVVLFFFDLHRSDVQMWSVGFLTIAISISIWIISGILHKKWICRKKFCTWCGEKSGLTKEKEYEGKYVWDNQDASGLKIKGYFNFEKANYYTFWRCKKCSALTELEHNMDKNPSSSVKVIAVFLSKEGEGERTAKDWQMKGILNVADSSGGREII